MFDKKVDITWIFQIEIILSFYVLKKYIFLNGAVRENKTYPIF